MCGAIFVLKRKSAECSRSVQIKYSLYAFTRISYILYVLKLQFSYLENLLEEFGVLCSAAGDRVEALVQLLLRFADELAVLELRARELEHSELLRQLHLLQLLCRSISWQMIVLCLVQYHLCSLKLSVITSCDLSPDLTGVEC